MNTKEIGENSPLVTQRLQYHYRNLCLLCQLSDEDYFKFNETNPIQSRIFGGVKYILIQADESVEISGINIFIS